MTGASIMTDGASRQHVRQVVTKSNTSFYWGMRLLPPERRDAMYAVYAFCREVDDVADGTASESEKRAALTAWRAEVDVLYDGRPTRPVGKALLDPVRAYDLPKEEFLALIDGMDTDASDHIHGMSFDELHRYCRRVAGAVGMLSLPIFGETSAVSKRLAVAQGEALQLTNILRDIVEDAARDRLYLPHELLDKHGIATRVPNEVLAHPELPAVCNDLAVLANHQYRTADSLMDQCDAKAIKPARLMMEAYRVILRRMERRGWQDFAEPVQVPAWAKLWVVLRYGVL
jgi:squalene synthase HpnD